MNNTFSFKRFFNVLGNECRLNNKKALLFWGGIIIIFILFCSLFYSDNKMIPRYFFLLLSFSQMCILQGFYLQFYYNEFTSKNKTQSLLLLPASGSEVFWAKFLLGFVVYPVIFSLLIFFSLKLIGDYNDGILSQIDNMAKRNDQYTYYQVLPVDIFIKLIFLLVWLFSASAYLFGIMLFKKLAVFKSLILWFVVVVGLILVTRVVYVIFTGDWPNTAIPGFVIGGGSNKRNEVCLLYRMYPEALYCLGIFICLALVFISKVKYNEKTI